jgi:hypothetical protein
MHQALRCRIAEELRVYASFLCAQPPMLGIVRERPLHVFRALQCGDTLAISAYAKESRRFPPLWRNDPMPGGYVVSDADGHGLAYLYSRDNEDEARQAKVLTKDEARRIAINIAQRGGSRTRPRYSPDKKPKNRRRFVSGMSARANHFSASFDQSSLSLLSTAAAANLLHSCALVLRNF